MQEVDTDWHLEEHWTRGNSETRGRLQATSQQKEGKGDTGLVVSHTHTQWKCRMCRHFKVLTNISAFIFILILSHKRTQANIYSFQISINSTSNKLSAFNHINKKLFIFFSHIESICWHKFLITLNLMPFYHDHYLQCE